MPIRGIRYRAAGAVSLSILLITVCLGQSPEPRKVTLAQAVETALENYPALRAAQADKKAAEAEVEQARTSFLPRADLLWQENRATRNNVFGLLLPQSVLPSISGPDLGARTLESTWGSAGGLMISWEPFDMGLRKAQVDLAKSLDRQATADEAVTRLEVSAKAAEAFLSVLAAQQARNSAAASLERAQTIAGAVKILVENQLRPGVDASRADAEVAAARVRLIQAEAGVKIAGAELAEAMGIAGTEVSVTTGPLLDPPPGPAALTPDFSLHPLTLSRTARIDAAKAQQKVFDRSWFPRFNWQTSIYGRGTGARLDGTFNNSRGWYPDTFNWATGVTVTFPIMDFFGLRARRRAAEFRSEAEEARRDEVINTLRARDTRAQAIIDSAQRIAAETPVQVRAASQTLERARTRYEYGLTNITEVADAQRLMAQAEIDDALARLAVWRALLTAAQLSGDLTPFLQMTGK